MKLQKLTNSRQKEEKRRFEDACGLAHALDLLGERWAMLVLRELAYGPRRFSGLKRDLPGISANILTQRLNELEARGLVRKTRLPPPASVQVYEATEWGLEVVPVIASLGAKATLHEVEGGDHSFAVLKKSGRTNDEALTEVLDALAAWIDRLA